MSATADHRHRQGGRPPSRRLEDRSRGKGTFRSPATAPMPYTFRLRATDVPIALRWAEDNFGVRINVQPRGTDALLVLLDAREGDRLAAHLEAAGVDFTVHAPAGGPGAGAADPVA